MDNGIRYADAVARQWSQVKDDICSLDLIMFRGAGLVSRAIKAASKMHTGNGDYSHVGLVVTRELLPCITEMTPGTLYVIESLVTSAWKPETDGVPNIHGGYRVGVQIRNLQDVIAAYDGSVVWVPVENSPVRHDGKVSVNVARTMMRVYKQYGSAPYDFLLPIYAVTPRWLHRCMCCDCLWYAHDRISVMLDHMPAWVTLLDPDARFCSELVADIYQRLGLLRPYIDSYQYTPVELLEGLADEEEQASSLDVRRSYKLLP